MNIDSIVKAVELYIHQVSCMVCDLCLSRAVCKRTWYLGGSSRKKGLGPLLLYFQARHPVCPKLSLVPRLCDSQCGETAFRLLSCRKRVPVCCPHATTIGNQASTGSGGSVADVRKWGAVISVFVCSLFSPVVALHPPPNKQTHKKQRK